MVLVVPGAGVVIVGVAPVAIADGVAGPAGIADGVAAEGIADDVASDPGGGDAPKSSCAVLAWAWSSCILMVRSAVSLSADRT